MCTALHSHTESGALKLSSHCACLMLGSPVKAHPVKVCMSMYTEHQLLPPEELSLKVPWKKLARDPTVVKVSGVYLVLSPNTCEFAWMQCLPTDPFLLPHSL